MIGGGGGFIDGRSHPPVSSGPTTRILPLSKLRMIKIVLFASREANTRCVFRPVFGGSYPLSVGTGTILFVIVLIALLAECATVFILRAFLWAVRSCGWGIPTKSD